MPGLSLSHSGPFILGFTGHRRVENEGKVADVLREVIASIHRDLGGDLIGRSSVASGGDTLFAEACFAAHYEWIALLPFPEAEFKKDFNDTDWKRARALLDRALRVETLANTTERPGGYLHCGLATVNGADLVVALWDGKAPAGPGGPRDCGARPSGPEPLSLFLGSLEVTRERFP